MPEKVKAFYAKQNITTLYPPQQKAIEAGALDGKNLVAAIPTASGKTLIAETCFLKTILERGMKCLYLTPLRALASEKYDDFLLFEELGVKVGVTTGDYDSADEKLGVYDLLVCTNERADSLLRHQASWLSQIGIVIADEVHLINDTGRGPTLEVVLVRLKQVAPKAQILALSATVGNAEELAAWLEGVAVTSEWRPVTLREGVYHEGRVRFAEGDEERYTPASSFPIGDITRQVLRDEGQLLIFLNTRKSAMNTAQRLGPIVSRFLSKQDRSELDEISRRILQSGEVTQVTDRLAKLVSAGVAFHHAGLRHTERKLIEDAFRQALIKAVCCTPTLAAGINMPARLVVINEYRRFDRTEGYQPIPVLEYKQMAGRAGRPKYDKTGTSVLMARRHEEVAFLMDNYVLGDAENVVSKLASES
ncbi:MAG: DEAD/DEAH box helicase, partial [Promethearchaeota archaeon]